MRFVIDTAPPDDELTETVVMADRSAGRRSSKVALIDVRGVIVDAPRRQFIGVADNPVSRFAESLRKAEDDTKVRAVIIRINSPGGGVTATDVMYREVLEFKKRSNFFRNSYR